MSEEQKPNLLIIGNLHSRPSPEAFLKKFLRVICPLFDSISLISGDLPSDFRSNIQWIRTGSVMDGKKSILIRLINFSLKQIRVTIILLKLSRKNKFNVIVFLTVVPIPMLFAKLMGKKIILHQGASYSKQTFHYNYKKNFKKYLLTIIFENLPFTLSDKIIIKSKSSLTFQNLERYSNKVVMGGLYVDMHLFNYKKEIKKRKERIGYIGNLYENKGVDNFSKAIIMSENYLKDRDVEVIIGGDGLLFSSIREMIETSGLSKRVTFTGWIPHEKVSEYLNELKLLVLPSYSEGMPNIVLEAMACGTPVLATPVGGIPDVIKDGETGFIMENNSPECIAENVMRALEHTNLDIIVKNARELVEREFTYEAAVERYKKVLDNVTINRLKVFDKKQ